MLGKRKEREPLHDEPSESRRDIPHPPLVYRPRDLPEDDTENALSLEQARQIQYEASHPLAHRPKKLPNDDLERAFIQCESSHPQTSRSEHPPDDGLEHLSAHGDRMVSTTTQPAFRWLRCCILGLFKTPFTIKVTLNVNTVGSLRQWVDLNPSISTFITLTKPIKDGMALPDIIILDEDLLITSNYPLSGDPDFDIIIVRMNREYVKACQRSGKPPYFYYQMSVIHHQYSPVNELDDARTCFRKDTVSKLAHLLDKEKLVLVRGTPASGKTTILRLLKQHLRQQGRDVYSITLSKFSIRSADHILHSSVCLFEGVFRRKYYVDPPLRPFSSNKILLIDEAQTSFSNYRLWKEFLQQLEGMKSKLSSNGRKLDFIISYTEPPKFTPVTFGSQQRVSMNLPQRNGVPQIGLYYTEDEFEEVVQKTCLHYANQTIALDKGARYYIRAVTDGHPGAVASVLEYLLSTLPILPSEGAITITQGDVVQALEEEGQKIFRKHPVVSSLPSRWKLLTRATKSILYHVLEHGYIDFDLSNEGIQKCYETGWIHRTQESQESFLPSESDICVFPSRLHEKYIEFRLGEQRKKLPERFTDITSLCYEIAKNFSPRNLQHCLKGKLSTAEKLCPIEAHYQDEFYRSFNATVGRGVPIDSKWARTLDGRVDFWIPEKKWAVDLLRDHEGIDEHCDRFNSPTGQYQPWTENGKIKDWIILDCAQSLPEKAHPDPKLVFLIFSEDYSNLTVYDHNLILVFTIPLSD